MSLIAHLQDQLACLRDQLARPATTLSGAEETWQRAQALVGAGIRLQERLLHTGRVTWFGGLTSHPDVTCTALPSHRNEEAWAMGQPVWWISVPTPLVKRPRRRPAREGT